MTGTAPRRMHRVVIPMVALRLLGQASEFVGWVILARRLGTSDFGELSIAFLVCRYLGLIADWGASIQGTRDVAAGSNDASIRGLIRRRNIATLALAAGYVAVVTAIGQPGLAPLAGCILARGLGRDWMALGRERGSRSGAPATTQGVLVMVGALLVSTLPAAAAMIGVAYCSAAVLSIALNRLPPAKSGGHPAPVDPWFLIILFADQIYASMDVVLLGALQSTSVAGIYAAVYRFPNAWVTVIGLVITGLLPGITRALTSDPTRIAELRRRALRVGGGLAALLILLIPAAWFLVPVVFGPAYEPGRVPLVLLLLATTATTLTVGLAPIYFAIGNERALAAWAVLVAVVNVVGNLLLIPHFSATGAASVTLASQLLVSGFYLITTRRLARGGPGRSAALTPPPRPTGI
jgi:O-antigen/teichoic acid export membrane protein